MLAARPAGPVSAGILKESRAITDWLVQRFDKSGPAGVEGVWVDEGIARDLKADEAERAVAIVAAKHTGYLNVRRRATKWDHVEEFDTRPGNPVVTSAVKAEAG